MFFTATSTRRTPTVCLPRRSRGVRVVFTEHGRGFIPTGTRGKRRIVNQVLVRLTDETVAISAATRDALVEREWFPPRKTIRLVYNGVAPRPVCSGSGGGP